MKTTASFLDDLQRKFALPSDYAVGKLLGMHRQQISHYRNLKGAFDDAIALRVAELLDLDPGYVMACMHAQRAKEEPVRKAWAKAAKALAGTAVALVMGSALALGGSGSFDITDIIATAASAAPVQFIDYAHFVLMLTLALALALHYARHARGAPGGLVR